MPHASIGKTLEIIKTQNMAIRAIPEVESVTGKIGRVESALDPAPTSMIETVVNYRSEYMTDAKGRRVRFAYDGETDEFRRDAQGDLMVDPKGRPFRQWRPRIKTVDDIWNEISRAAEIPGVTQAPKLQPIATRIIMLQTGMRASMGVKIFGPDLRTIERVGYEVERLLKEVSQVNPETVIADRVVAQPYLEIEIDRAAIARYGMHIRQVQDVLETALGGQRITTTVQGRERYPVRVRYLRELRDHIESLERILIPSAGEAQIPLGQLAAIRFRPGPMAIKSEDTLLTGYVIFDKRPEVGEVDAVEACRRHLEAKRRSGEFVLPSGVSYRFAGNYENQVRSEKRLRLILPIILTAIFIILYLRFHSISTAGLIFANILIAWTGGFIMLWLYGREGFLDFNVLGTDLRDLFQVHPIHLSVAVWVGFLALFGIADDNGVILATYLKQRIDEDHPDSVQAVRQASLAAAARRIRPCMMTSATTILALLPVLTSTGRGADVMVPMAIPSFGGMAMVFVSGFVVPVLFCAVEEFKLKNATKGEAIK
jgi:Cu(I)/Ag(I) efflux system membrane protein CusA/SilA